VIRRKVRDNAEGEWKYKIKYKFNSGGKEELDPKIAINPDKKNWPTGLIAGVVGGVGVLLAISLYLRRKK
jgi:hypothetical protein